VRLGITVRLHSLAKNSDPALLISPGLANVSQCPHRGKISRHKNLTSVTPSTSVLQYIFFGSPKIDSKGFSFFSGTSS
jgi:hypothetical protein